MIRTHGRKFTVTVFGLVLVPACALLKAPADAYTAVALLVASFCGGNAMVEWRHGSNPVGTTSSGPIPPSAHPNFRTDDESGD